jgi:chromosome segregation ATPase
LTNYGIDVKSASVMATKNKLVSEKNTKSEILQAYEELMGELSNEAEFTKPEIEAQEIIKTASTQTTEKTINDLAKLKVSLNQTIDNLTDSLVSEAEKLVSLKKAVEISRSDLEQNYQIKSKAEMLKKLFESHSEKQSALEKEMNSKHKEWEEEQKSHEESLKRKRQRDEEEYKYQADLENRRWGQKLEEEKQSYQQKLVELSELTKQVAQFPQEKEKAIAQSVEKALAESHKQAEVDKSFAQQKTESTLKTRSQII